MKNDTEFIIPLNSEPDHERCSGFASQKAVLMWVKGCNSGKRFLGIGKRRGFGRCFPLPIICFFWNFNMTTIETTLKEVNREQRDIIASWLPDINEKLSDLERQIIAVQRQVGQVKQIIEREGKS